MLSLNSSSCFATIVVQIASPVTFTAVLVISKNELNIKISIINVA